MTDPMEHFGEQQQSWEAVERFGKALAQQAREIRGQHPDADMVGLILSGDCSEAAELMKLPQMQAASDGPGGSNPAGQGIVTLVPRPIAVGLIQVNHPALREWLASAEHTESGGKLPILVITRSGARTALVPYSSDEATG